VALVRKAARESTWDGGAIRAFMKETEEARVWLSGGQCDDHRDDPGRYKLIVWGKTTDRDDDGIAQRAFRILTWIGVPAPFTVVLWWREDPRRIRADEWPTKKTVNGGWTTSGGASTVYIYRSEEWTRVLIHEVIHAMEWDLAMPRRPLPCWGLPVGSKVSSALFEAWTELFAEWLWCAWNGNTLAIWKKQRDWQDAQAIQILARQGDAPWKEDTSVFAYYVLKAALAPHIEVLWVRGGDELCEYSASRLNVLREAARHQTPVGMSLRMTFRAEN
jgi:hypothetical protein